jgi:hypothetical protein
MESLSIALILSMATGDALHAASPLAPLIAQTRNELQLEIGDATRVYDLHCPKSKTCHYPAEVRNAYAALADTFRQYILQNNRIAPDSKGGARRLYRLALYSFRAGDFDRARIALSDCQSHNSYASSTWLGVPLSDHARTLEEKMRQASKQPKIVFGRRKVYQAEPDASTSQPEPAASALPSPSDFTCTRCPTVELDEELTEDR